MISSVHQGLALKRWHVSIPHAQILTLQSAPLANVASPESSTGVLVVVGPVSVAGQVGAGAYTGNAATTLVQLQYNGNTSFVAANSANFTAAIGATNPFITVNSVFGNPAANVALLAGQPLSLALINGGSNLGGGAANNSMVVEFCTVEFDGAINAF